MRFAVALCFLVAFCTIDANSASDDLEIWRLQVRNAKWTVDGIIRQLQDLRSQAEEDALLKVTEQWDGELESYRSFKNTLLNGIKKDINAATAAGKDVKACNKEAQDGIKQNEDAAYEDATKCSNIAENSIQNTLGFIDNLILTGNALSSELDSIFLTCHDSDIIKMQNCIITELARVNADIKALQSDANSAEITVVHVSNNVVLQATNCLKNAYSSVYSTGVRIKMRIAQCIEDASEPTTITTKVTTEATTKATTKKPTKF
ncbi:unnamed protein product [Lasius platythorax]|uniref:Uncharacterized protein n=1 Tax=Lasius platythorax TaxID=488582 RepID=A0AAV2NBI4_9HYME